MLNNEFINILINTALKSNMTHKHACIIIHRNKIISTGYNYYKFYNGKIYSNCNNAYEINKYSIHAEQNAIQKIKNKNILRECKIYIIRLKNCNCINNKYLDIYYNNIEEGIPCIMCNNLLKKYNLTYKKTIN